METTMTRRPVPTALLGPSLAPLGHPVSTLLRTVFLVVCLGSASAAPVPKDLPDRVFVDKDFSKTLSGNDLDGVLSRIKAAGFTHYASRFYFDDLQKITDLAGRTAKVGLKLLVWMRGSLSAKSGDSEAFVGANGKPQGFKNPNSLSFRTYLEKYAVSYSKLAQSYPNVAGVFLDFENYFRNKESDFLYSYSYDSESLRQFFSSSPELVKLAKDLSEENQRLVVLKDYSKEYQTFQEALWAQSLGDLYQKTRSNAQNFRFFVYPSQGSPFLEHSLWFAFGGQQGGLVLADSKTFGYPSRYPTEALAVFAGRHWFTQDVQRARNAGISAPLLVGLDPIREGVSPEYLKQMVRMAQDLGSGYWVFFEGAYTPEKALLLLDALRYNPPD